VYIATGGKVAGCVRGFRGRRSWPMDWPAWLNQCGRDGPYEAIAMEDKVSIADDRKRRLSVWVRRKSVEDEEMEFD